MFDFIAAAKGDDVETLSRIFHTSNIAIDKSDWVNNESALTISSRFGRHNNVHFLLTNGADVNRANRKGKIALYYAIKENHIGCLEHILAHKDVHLNVSMHGGLTPLMLSAKLGFDICVKLLIEHGCDLNTKSGSENKGSIHYCIQPEPWEKVLVQKNTLQDDHRFQCLKALVESGADINLADGTGMTPLHYAIRNQNVRAVELLVLEGCSVNSTASWEDARSCCIGPVTSALLASYVCNTRITSVLLAAGCNFLNCPAMMKIKSNHPHVLCLGQYHHTPEMISTDVHPIKTNPKHLISLCRFAIRKFMGQNISRCSDQLKIPKLIEDYVCKTEYEK